MGDLAWSDLPSDTLRDVVAHAHRSRANWMKSRGPRAIRSQKIDLKNRGGFFGKVLGVRNGELDEKRVGIKFVRGSGGRYVTLRWTTGYLQLWDIQEDTCLWTYPALGDFASEEVLACDFEAVKASNNSEWRVKIHVLVSSETLPIDSKYVFPLGLF